MTFFKVNATQVFHNFNTVTPSVVREWLGDNSHMNALSIATAVMLMIVYWLFYVPCNWKRHLEDVGYDLALGSDRKLNSTRKRDAINRIRKLRKIGINELPPPYPNGWYSVMESSALEKKEAKSVSCLGETFVVYRTEKNEVNILDAYCPHLGANMGVGGRVVGDNIECPFHLWSFRGSDGKCVNVPYSTCAPNGSKVRKWISKEIDGNIFVWYHAEADAIPWELPIISEIENNEFVFHGRNEFYVNCHIQEIPENGADLAHFTAIHNASVLAGGSNPLSSPLANAGIHHWQATWQPSEYPSKHIAKISLQHSLEIFPKFHMFQMNIIAEQIGPSYVQLHMNSPAMGRFEILQTVTPIEPLVQKVVHRFYGPRILAPFMKFAIFGESIMFERDVNMWNHKTFLSKPQLVKEDAALKSYRNWYSQFYSDNSKPFSEARDNFDW